MLRCLCCFVFVFKIDWIPFVVKFFYIHLLFYNFLAIYLTISPSTLSMTTVPLSITTLPFINVMQYFSTSQVPLYSICYSSLSNSIFLLILYSIFIVFEFLNGSQHSIQQIESQADCTDESFMGFMRLQNLSEFENLTLSVRIKLKSVWIGIQELN